MRKRSRGKLSYGSSGNGSVSHLMGEQFKLATGTDLLHVPYRGVGPALNDAVSGQIQVMFDNLPTSLPLVQAGRLRALAVSSPRRLPALPEVPTFAELKLDDLDWIAFFGLVAPAKHRGGMIAAQRRVQQALAIHSCANVSPRSRLPSTPGSAGGFRRADSCPRGTYAARRAGRPHPYRLIYGTATRLTRANFASRAKQSGKQRLEVRLAGVRMQHFDFFVYLRSNTQETRVQIRGMSCRPL